MVLGGLWHGAAETFLIWGSIHGIALVLTHLAHAHPLPVTLKIPRSVESAIKIGFTFHLVTFAWIFFRAPTLEAAGGVIKTLFTSDFGAENISLGVVVALGAAAVSQFAPRAYFEKLLSGFKRLPAPAQAVILLVSIFLAKTVANTQVSSFIYAKF
jgi:alginate O-acetyltransferase complex protein AlgI